MSNDLLTIQIALNAAKQADLEQGVKWLNECACKEFRAKYPNIDQVINNILEMEVEDETV